MSAESVSDTARPLAITDGMGPEDVLEVAFNAIDAAGNALGAGATRETVFGHLHAAFNAVAFLRSWDVPPDPGAWTIWQRRVIEQFCRNANEWCMDGEIVRAVRECGDKARAVPQPQGRLW